MNDWMHMGESMEGSVKQTVGILTKQAKNGHGGESLQI